MAQEVSNQMYFACWMQLHCAWATHLPPEVVATGQHAEVLSLHRIAQDIGQVEEAWMVVAHAKPVSWACWIPLQ